jgi:hypothetical protein
MYTHYFGNNTVEFVIVSCIVGLLLSYSISAMAHNIKKSTLNIIVSSNKASVTVWLSRTPETASL